VCEFSLIRAGAQPRQQFGAAARGLIAPGGGAPDIAIATGSCRAVNPDKSNSACRPVSDTAMPRGRSSSPRRKPAAVRSAFDRGGEVLAAIEPRGLFPGDFRQRSGARDGARTIAGWKPLAPRPEKPRIRRVRTRS
jgi:hypothetical protein